MVKVSLTRQELNAIVRLIIENMNSAKLQKITYLSYLDSITLKQKLNKYSNA